VSIGCTTNGDDVPRFSMASHGNAVDPSLSNGAGCIRDKLQSELPQTSIQHRPPTVRPEAAGFRPAPSKCIRATRRPVQSADSSRAPSPIGDGSAVGLFGGKRSTRFSMCSSLLVNYPN
jgi:hypothetical protein